MSAEHRPQGAARRPARRRAGVAAGRRRHRGGLVPAAAPAAAQDRGLRCGLAGIEGPLEIARDRWGVPHLEPHPPGPTSGSARGSSTPRTGSGRWTSTAASPPGGSSEIAGEAGLPSDRLMRTLGLRHVAELEEARARSRPARPARLLLRRGQRRRRSACGALPFEIQLLRLEFEPWRPADILSLGKLLAFGLSTNWERELLRADMVRELGAELTARLDPAYPAENPIATQEPLERGRAGAGRADRRGAKGRWACRSRPAARTTGRSAAPLSATGGPLIAGDPHLLPSMPGIWYQVSLAEGDRFARGASMPGLPGIYMGQNNDVAWTFTNVDGRRAGPVRRADRGRPLPLRGRVAAALDGGEEEIPVKGRDAAGGARGARHPPRPDRQRGARRRRRPSRWRCAGSRSTSRPPTPGCSSVLDVASGPELVAMLAGHTTPGLEPDLGRPPRLDRLQADRPPAAARAAAAPTCRSRAGRGEFEWEGDGPLRGAARADRPRERLPGHRQQPDRRRRLSRTTSPASGSTASAPGGSSSCSARPTSTTSTASSGCRPTSSRSPAWRRRAGSAGCARAASASCARSSGCAAGTGGSSPDSVAGLDLPGLPAAARARGRAGGDRRPRPRRALARPRRQRLHRPRHLALALALAPDGPLGGGRRRR